MKKYLLILVVSLILLNGCEKEIGGEKDEHGCYLMAGYTWCEAKEKCLRSWEEDCEDSGSKEIEAEGKEVKIIEIAKDYVRRMGQYENNNGRGLSVRKIYQARCPGCYAVELEFYLDAARDSRETDKAEVKLNIEDWEVTDSEYTQKVAKILTPQQCLDEGGRNVNVVGGDRCEKGEKSIGDVKGFISPNICCKANPELNIEEALKIAKDSECGEKGKMTIKSNYNPSSQTWWIDLDVEREFEKEGCNPACVVFEESKRAEINWRCTGLVSA